MAGYDVKPNKFAVFFAYLIMIFSLGRMFAVGMSLDMNIWLEIGLVVLIGGIMSFLVLKPLYLIALMIASVVGAILLDSVWSGFYPLARNAIFDLVNNVINNLSGVENISVDNRLPLWIIIITIIALYTSLVIFKDRRRLFLPALYMPVFLIYWYSFYDSAFVLMVLFIFSYLVIIGYDSLLRSDSERGDVNNGIFFNLYPSWMNVVLIYSIVIALLASTLPGTTDYIRWNWLNERVTSAFPAIEELRSSEGVRRVSGDAQSFEFSTTGFQGDSSRLGGPVEIDDTVVITLRGDRVNYLRGNVNHSYTGSGWLDVPKFYAQAQEGADFSRLSPEEKSLYYRDIGFSITYEKISSTTVFSTFLPYSFTFDGSSSVLVNEDYSIVYPDGIYAGETYFLRAYTPRSYGIQVERGIDRSIDDVMLSEIYLNLPDTITDRTIQLADEITAGFDSPMEKALAIESYLRSNYEYSLEVPHVPENMDFVDYFLFEEEQGYCTYYASAMAILLRIQGIPTRYVEGFIVPSASDNELYEVKNSNAHAWVEAFIEPVGWTVFEATPAYSPPARLLDYDPQLDEDIEADENMGRSRDRESVDGREENVSNDIGVDSDLDNTGNQDSSLKTDSFALLALVVITLVIVWRFFRGIFFERNKKLSYAGLDNKEKAIYQYYLMTQLIEKLGYAPNPGETHFEYSNRIAHKFHEFGKFGFKQATQLFVKSKYGDYCPSSDEVDTLEIYRKRLDLQLKRHLGPMQYNLEKLTLLLKSPKSAKRSSR
ncbi:transglutaminase TgpA family protein [Gudongella sp. SC589]|uniref:transglutaminase TgpA family protein n=1 Tax=Gudongella sp. SC589 TaxID=3385990 RepID=UPI00390474AA